MKIDPLELVAISMNLGLDVVLKEGDLSGAELDEFNKEHPRAKDGKFTSGSGDTGVSDDKISTAKKVAGATAVVAGSYMMYRGMKLLPNTELGHRYMLDRLGYEAFLNKLVDRAGGTPNSVVEGLANLSVAKNRLPKDAELHPVATSLVDYVSQPEKMRLDLAETFGHLDIPGATNITINNNNLAGGIRTYDEFYDGLTCFEATTNRININTNEIGLAYDTKLLDLTPEQLIRHEYAHSLTMNGSPQAIALVNKHKAEYFSKVKAWEGQRYAMNVANPIYGLVKETGTVVKVTPKTRLYRDVMSEQMEQLEKMGVVIGNRQKRLDNLGQQEIHYFEITLKNDNGLEYESNSLYWNQMWSNSVMNGAHPNEVFQFPGLKGGREAYGISSLSEYLSVKVEKGIKL